MSTSFIIRAVREGAPSAAVCRPTGTQDEGVGGAATGNRVLN